MEKMKKILITNWHRKSLVMLTILLVVDPFWPKNIKISINNTVRIRHQEAKTDLNNFLLNLKQDEENICGYVPADAKQATATSEENWSGIFGEFLFITVVISVLPTFKIHCKYLPTINLNVLHLLSQWYDNIFHFIFQQRVSAKKIASNRIFFRKVATMFCPVWMKFCFEMKR